jgi:hypothetical protein
MIRLSYIPPSLGQTPATEHYGGRGYGQRSYGVRPYGRRTRSPSEEYNSSDLRPGTKRK